MATKITNSVLFRAMRWLVDNANISDAWLDDATSREIVDLYELWSGLYTVEYTGASGRFGWSGVTYERAVSYVASVVGMDCHPEVWRDSDRECMTGLFLAQI